MVASSSGVVCLYVSHVTHMIYEKIENFLSQEAFGGHLINNSIRPFSTHTPRGHFSQPGPHRNSVHQSMSSWWVARKFLDGMRTGSPRSYTLAIHGGLPRTSA